MSIRIPARIFAAVLALALVAFPAQAQEQSAPEADIVDTAMQAEGFNTLVDALKAADLVETLRGEGPFTVFAPTDEAFAALPDGQLESLLKPENKEQLQAILKYHVVSGNVMASDVAGLEQAESVEGRMIGIQAGEEGVTLTGDNTASVVQTDIKASNGVIHVIDSVLLPPPGEATSR